MNEKINLKAYLNGKVKRFFKKVDKLVDVNLTNKQLRNKLFDFLKKRVDEFHNEIDFETNKYCIFSIYYTGTVFYVPIFINLNTIFYLKLEVKNNTIYRKKCFNVISNSKLGKLIYGHLPDILIACDISDYVDEEILNDKINEEEEVLNVPINEILNALDAIERRKKFINDNIDRLRKLKRLNDNEKMFKEACDEIDKKFKEIKNFQNKYGTTPFQMLFKSGYLITTDDDVIKISIKCDMFHTVTIKQHMARTKFVQISENAWKVDINKLIVFD